MLVETPSCIEEVTRDRLPLREIGQEASHAVTPAFSSQRQEQCLHGFLRRLLRGKARLLIVAHIQGVVRMLEIALCLRQPVHRSVGHVFSPPSQGNEFHTHSGGSVTQERA